jgi:lipopolysaccharide transport system permease protein
MLTVDEVKRAYAGSMLGWFWVLLKPALVVGLYGILFGVIFQTRGGPVPTSTEYLLLLLTGLAPWLIFSDAMSAAAGSITANAALATKVLFPVEVLPISKSLAAMVSGLVSLGLLVLVLVGLHGWSWGLILLPALVVLYVVFTMGLAWIMASVNVLVRDTAQAVPVALMALMFLSPVVYTRDMVPQALGAVFSYNPIAYFLDAYRSILLADRSPGVQAWTLMIFVAVGAFVAGLGVVSRMRAYIADRV